MTVFRIQDKDGRGPWKPGFSLQWTEDKSEEEYARLVPWPLQFGRVDQLAMVGTAVGCACTSLDQLRLWFTPGEYAKLRKLGYQAVRMKVGRVLARSDVQCVFERATPLAVDVEPIHLYPHQ